MAFTYVFSGNSSVLIGDATKASNYRTLANNTDALKERYVKNFHFNNTGTLNEDGFARMDYTQPFWFYAKATGSASYKYVGLWLYVNGATSHLRMKIQGSTAAPANPTAGVAFMLGEYS